MPKKADYLVEFPFLKTRMSGSRICYLDNAATSQKPAKVIKALNDYYTSLNANIHRGIYEVAEKATTAYEATRKTVSSFINAASPEEIVFTRNTTESINLVAYTWGEKNIKKGDEIIVSLMEHHSNLIPWQELCRRKKAILKVIPLAKDLNLDLDAFQKLLTRKTKLVAVTQMANVTGTITPINRIIRMAHQKGALVMIDGAQGVPHLGIDVKKSGCDFLAFSSHKMCGPTGVGVLYAKRKILEKMDPFLFGGEMIKEVTLKKATWNDLPWKFEAGTPNIADVIAFNEALKYLQKVGFKNIYEHDLKLVKYAFEKLKDVPGLKVYLPKKWGDASGIFSFTIKGVHPHDIGSIFNSCGVAIRVGFLCAEPYVKKLGAENGVARMSFYFYNTQEDVDRAVIALKKVISIFKIKD